MRRPKLYLLSADKQHSSHQTAGPPAIAPAPMLMPINSG